MTPADATSATLRACALALALAGRAALAADSPEALAVDDPAPRLRVCYFEFAPLVSRDAAGRPQGLYVDLLEQAARDEGWRLDWQHATWDGCLRALDAATVDLVPVVGRSEERAKRFAFSEEVPVLDWGVVFTREGSPIETIFDLRGRRIGVLRGSIYTEGFRALFEQFGIAADIVEKDGYRDVFRALERGEIDAGINAQIAGTAIAPEYHLRATQIYFSPVRLAYAAPRDRAFLLRVLDRRLAALKATPGSPWEEAFARWMPGRPEQRVPRWLAAALACVAALLAISVAFTWVLRRQVAARTADLAAANAHLRESQALLRTVTDVIPDPIFIKDRDGRWLFGNPGAQAAVGRPLEAIVGRTDAEIYDDPAVGAALMDIDRRIMASGEGDTVEETIQTPAGYRTYLSTKVPNLDGDGRVVGIVGIARDITDQRRTEEQLRQSQKLESIGRLAGGVAHDFNNLLTVILSCAATLQEDLRAGAPAAPEDVDEIHAAGRRAADLTRQLLAFARKQVIAPVPLDVNAVVRGSEKLLRRVLGEDVELVVTLQPDLGAVRCDPGQLEQVILNLAVNARDAMPRGGRLSIETSNARARPDRAAARPDGPAQYVRLVIRDDGEGMSPEVKAHLFEPFFTTKAPGRGTGLGLATVYGIVKQSEGDVHVESEVGEGTTVEVWLPRTSDAAVPVAAPHAAEAAGGTERLLVVEDDPRVRDVTVRSLRGGGYDVLVAGSGAEALALDPREVGGVRLLVTDVVMPGLDGRALATELVRRHPDLRVLYVSGYAQDAIAARGVLESGVELLPKPFTAAALLAKVRAVLDGAGVRSP